MNTTCVSPLSEALVNVIPVATYADLIALTPPTETTYINLLGYYAKGDGGGGPLYFDTASTATHNAGTVIKPTAVSGASPGRWLRVYSGAINVKWFGAKGDGTTDDASAINAALATGKDVVFPEGDLTFLFGTGLVPVSNQRVDLGGNTIKQASGSEIGDLLLVGSGKSNVTIENGTIDVNVAQQTYVGSKSDVGRAIFVSSATDVTVRGVKFRNTYGSMVLAASSTRVNVDGCDINDTGATGTNAIVFNACTDCIAQNNTGEGQIGVTGYGVYALGTSSQIRAINNRFKHYQIVFIGTDYITGGGSSGMLYCSIDDNVLLSPSADTSIHFGLYGSVCDNIIVDSRDVGISVDFSRNLKVNNNVLRTTNAGGIVMPGCLDCVVDGNMLSNPGSEFVAAVTAGARTGVWVPATATGSPPSVNPTGNVITNNTIRDTLGTPKMYYGISLADNAGANINVVRGNYIAGATQADYDIPAQTNVGEFDEIKAPSYANSWVDYGAGFSAGGYFKTEDGVVSLRGLIKDGTVGNIAFTLPVGYRPLAQLMFSTITSTGIGRVDIFSNGDVYVISGGNGYVTLSGINFPALR